MAFQRTTFQKLSHKAVNRDKLMCSHTEDDVFSLSGAESNFCLQLAAPMDRATMIKDQKTSARENTVMQLSILLVLGASEISIHIPVQGRHISWSKV